MSQEHDKTETEVLQHLVKSKALEGSAARLARQVLAHGEKALSARQGVTFNTQVRAKYLTRVCELCGDLITMEEVMASWSNGGYCSLCAPIFGKDQGT